MKHPYFTDKFGLETTMWESMAFWIIWVVVSWLILMGLGLLVWYIFFKEVKDETTP